MCWVDTWLCLSSQISSRLRDARVRMHREEFARLRAAGIYASAVRGRRRKTPWPRIYPPGACMFAHSVCAPLPCANVCVQHQHGLQLRGRI